MDELIAEAISISAVIICYNEQATITATLDSLKDLTDEIVIVDTGSTDCTVELINQHPAQAKLYFRPWNNDFSAMRNHAISLAGCAWCLIIDADECLAPETRRVLRRTIKEISHADGDALYAPIIDNLDGSQLTNNARIFRKRPSLRYHGKVHEYLDEKNCRIISLPDIKIIHYGYINNVYSEKNKHERNSTLLEQQIDLEPDNLRWRFFALRYLKPDEAEYEKTLQLFGELTLPYPDEWEIYAFNVKSKLIISLLKAHQYQQAWLHAQSLYEYYKDKHTTQLYSLTRYLVARSTFITTAHRCLACFNDAKHLQADKYLTERFNISRYECVMDEMVLFADKYKNGKDIPTP
jgi:glycosyltransferase involved in cell wall biosynthesis